MITGFTGHPQEMLIDPRFEFGEAGNGPRLESLKTALVQDALPFYGGAERVLAQARLVFPRAPVYTLIQQPSALAGTPLEGAPIRASYLDRLPGARRHHRLFFPLYPRAVESLDLGEWEVVISFSYAAAHGVLTGPGQVHLALFYTPLRLAYREGHPLLSGGRLKARLLQRALGGFRRWDAAAASRPAALLAVSGWVASLARRLYSRPVGVLYPPVETERFHPSANREDYYLAVARLEPHKRLDLVVEAFNRLGRPLLLVGEGSQRRRLERAARGNIRFLGRLPDREVACLFNRAKALVHAGEEDFGISLVEAQAAGCPVIAYAGGGASETVLPGRTGLLFPEQSAVSLMEAVVDFEGGPGRFKTGDLRRWAERFSAGRFREGLAAAVQAVREGRLPGGNDGS
jgi:glycosyltransferase involved in cell wall biosynthesis